MDSPRYQCLSQGKSALLSLYLSDQSPPCKMKWWPSYQQAVHLYQKGMASIAQWNYTQSKSWLDNWAFCRLCKGISLTRTLKRGRIHWQCLTQTSLQLSSRTCHLWQWALACGRRICWPQLENGVTYLCPWLGWLNAPSKHWISRVKTFACSIIQTWITDILIQVKQEFR